MTFPFSHCRLPAADCRPFLALLLLAAAARAGEWKVPREYRRALVGGGDADTVVFSFCDGGHLQVGASDVTVADEQGRAVPSRVLWTRRGGDTWVAYNASRAKDPLHVYYGGRGGGGSGGGSAGGWQPKLSLLLFTMPLPSGALQSHRPIATAARSARAYGMGFVENIWHGFNPFGPDDHFASYYVGYLDIQKPGHYKFFTASDEASFVFLDGKPLCSWPGRHEAQGGRHGQHGDGVTLNKGQYKLEYYHAEVDGEQCMMLGWTPPGEQGWKVVPPSAFVHTPHARAGDPERRGGAPLAFLHWEQDDQLLLEEFQFTRVSFANRCRNVPPGAKLVWDFGDGVQHEGGEKEHIYVGDGPFTCVLRIVGEDGKALDAYAASIRIVAALKNYTILDENAVRNYVDTIVSTDCSKLPESAMDALWELVETQEDMTLIKPFVETYVRRFGAKGKAWHAADRLALAYSVKEPAKAIKLYGLLAAGAPTNLDAARAQMERIELILHKLKDPERALAVAQAVRATRSGPEDRIAAVKIGDIHRAKGEFEEAEKAYRDAQRITYAQMDRRVIAVRQGGYLETAAAHIEHGHLRAAREALVLWEMEHPIGKLSGDLILMTAKYFDKLGEPERALAELQAITQLNPLTPYLPEVELLMARAYRNLGDYTKARQLFDKVLREYPNSRAAEQARRE